MFNLEYSNSMNLAGGTNPGYGQKIGFYDRNNNYNRDCVQASVPIATARLTSLTSLASAYHAPQARCARRRTSTTT